MISKNQIKYIQSLHLKKYRDVEGIFIIEGIKLVTEFINSNSFEVKEIFATSEYISQYKSLLSLKKMSVTEVSNDDLKRISLQPSPNQVLALVYSKTNNFNTDLAKNELTLFLDDIRDPGNLGTIIRIADWFGIKQVVCSKTTTELYNPKTLQASMGAVLRVNVLYMDFTELKNIIPNLPFYGAVLNGKNIYTTKLSHGVIIIGNEANGISDAVLNSITHPITIPAASNNGSESLNAANACGMICSEFFRQLNYSA